MVKTEYLNKAGAKKIFVPAFCISDAQKPLEKLHIFCSVFASNFYLKVGIFSHKSLTKIILWVYNYISYMLAAYAIFEECFYA